MADQQYCLRWNNHQSTLISVFDSLQERGCMVDCTLAAEGQSLQAHKVVLSACSPYLEDLLSKHYDKHPILLLKDVKFEELKAMMDYMYRGEVNVAQDKLNTFLRAAESLQIKGLSDGGTDPPDSGGTTSTKRTAKGTPVSVRSNQLTVRKTNLDDSSSRDGSTSPSQRKRRRRRGSETSDIETSNVSDGKQSTAAAAPVSGPSETSPIVPASAPSDDNILSSITESAETENATDSGFSSAVPQEINNVIRDRDNALIEPKTEYVEDDGQDLNLEDEDGLFRAGPSHARGTYEGDGDDDVYMTNQDSGANAQDYPCRFCGKVLSRKWSWLQHEATHTGALPHRCPICERSFGNTYRLNRHMQSSHTDERPHRCDECGASFAVLASFQRHQRTHTGERAHVCTVCHKAFYEPYKLKRHMRVHGGKGHRLD